MCNVPSIQLTKHNSSLSKLNQVWAARFYKSRCSLMQPACVHHFGSNHFVITMKNCAKTILPFQSIIELENQLAHDAFNELIASNSCNYCLKVAAHLKLSFCRTNYILPIQLTKHNFSLSKPHQVWAAQFYKSRCSAMQPACVRHFWSNHLVITMDMINMFL